MLLTVSHWIFFNNRQSNCVHISKSKFACEFFLLCSPIVKVYYPFAVITIIIVVNCAETDPTLQIKIRILFRSDRSKTSKYYSYPDPTLQSEKKNPNPNRQILLLVGMLRLNPDPTFQKKNRQNTRFRIQNSTKTCIIRYNILEKFFFFTWT